MSAAAVIAAASIADRGHFEPLSVPLGDRVQLCGAMWTARLDLPWGPRPGRTDNCICIDYFECFSPADQDRIIVNYGPLSPRRYSDAPMGPIVDAGYHGQLPACDWRANPDIYFDAVQKAEDNGIHITHFLRPDRGCAGLEWTVDDLERELGSIFRSARAQRLMAKVVLGWEPGPKYFYDNAWWVEMLRWQADVFPRALRGLHMVADCDAPVGQDDDRKGITNGQGWANVAPYIHFWIVQNAGYVGSGDPIPSRAFVAEFVNQFNPQVRGSFPDRFGNGGPSGDWPTTSAWKAGEPRPLPGAGIIALPGEYAAFIDYWQNAPERYSQELGAAALAAGAVGFLDGGRVPVQR